jgi:citrate synthase
LKYQQGHIASPVVIEALNKLFILHADHEQNCSTSTVRMVGSSHAGLFASISRSFSIVGTLHGGANQAVLEMLEEIHQNGGMPINIWQKPKIKTIL